MKQKKRIRKTITTIMLLIALVTVQVMQTTALAAGTDPGGTPSVQVNTWDDLLAAVIASEDGAVIEIMGAIVVPCGLALTSDHTITLKRGTAQAYISTDWDFSGTKVTTFENMILDGADMDATESFLVLNANSEVKNCEIKGCKAIGGTVCINSGQVSFKECSFKDNQGQSGSHLMIQTDNKVIIQDCTFTGGQAVNGGAVFMGLEGCDVEIDGCTMTGNAASSNGGAIFNRGTLTISDSKIYGNTANKGADIYSSVGITIETQLTDLETIFEGENISVNGWLTETNELNEVFMKLDYEVITAPDPDDGNQDDPGEDPDDSGNTDPGTGDQGQQTPSEPGDGGSGDDSGNGDGSSDSGSTDVGGSDAGSGDSGSDTPSQPSDNPGGTDGTGSDQGNSSGTDDSGSSGDNGQTSTPSDAGQGDSGTGGSGSTDNSNNSTTDSSTSTDNSSSDTITDSSDHSTTTTSTTTSDSHNSSSTTTSNAGNTSTTNNSDNSRTDNSRTSTTDNHSSTTNNYYQTDSSQVKTPVQQTQVQQTPVQQSGKSEQPVIINNYIDPSMQSSGQTAGQASEQKDVQVSSQGQKGSSEAQNEGQAVQTALDPSNNIRIDAKGADVVFEVKDGVYSISINADQAAVPASVQTASEESAKDSGVNWYEVIKIALLLALFINLNWKGRKKDLA